ncbi:Transcription initiation factor TFIID subunit 9, partial [Cucurbita argyrosperma subsp. sororia]
MSRGNGGEYDNQNTIFSREARPSRVGERGSEEITEGEQDLPRDAKIEFTRSMQARLLCDGVTLAFQSKVNFSFSRPSPREVLLELARNRNKIPLPRSIGGPEFSGSVSTMCPFQ